MEIVTIQDLEETLSQTTDAVERRRLRGRIRRMRRKEGVSMDRVAVTRSRSRDPFANETEEAGVTRVHAAMKAAGISEDHDTLIGQTWYAFPLHTDVPSAVAKYTAAYGTFPAGYTLLEHVDGGVSMYALGPIS